jgi:thiol:disulfide interchange protein DsbD
MRRSTVAHTEVWTGGAQMRPVNSLGPLVLMVGLLTPLVVGCKGSPETATPPPGDSPKASATIAWVDGLAPGLAKAKAENKPAIVDFSAEWCTWCKKLDEQTWPDPQVRGLATQFVAVKVDVDKDQAAATKYGASSIPLIVFLKPDGTEIVRNAGFVEPGEMIGLMRKALGQ